MPKLVAHHASLLPSKPAGAAELLLMALSRSVRLASAGAGSGSSGAVAAHLGDGDGGGLWLPLPWLLTPSAVEELNGLRRALSATLGPEPKEQGEGAAALQLRLLRLSAADRPPLSAAQAGLAAKLVATAAAPAPDPAQAGSAELLPALALEVADGAEPLAGGDSGAERDAAGPAAAVAEEEDEGWVDDDDEPLEFLG